MIVCDVELVFPDGPVGVLCSGGADSSLLLYLLMKHIKNPIHIFTLTHKEKHYKNINHVLDVVKWCVYKTNNNNIHHHITYADSHTEKELYSTAFMMLKSKSINGLFIGDTCWPPDNINHSFGSMQTKLDRNPSVLRPTKIKNFYLPFTNYDKRKVAEIYRHLDVMDLFNLTRSCETLEHISNSHCGKCWWCQERMWAFDLTELK